jgi:predicted DNA-binding transcriptional regulator AlpA
MRLIFHPLPEDGEGLNGYLLRLVEGNSLPGIYTLFNRKAPSLEILTKYLGISGECRLLEKLFRQRGAAAKRALPMWNNQTSRYCPICVKQHPIWRQEWELSIFTVCAIHQCNLVDTCSKCMRRLNWSRASLMQCACGNTIVNAEAEASSDVASEFASLISDKLNDIDEHSPDHLQIMTLENLHRISVVLGGYANAQPGRRPLKIERFLDLTVARPLAVAAAEILIQDWPKSLHGFLDGLCGDEGGANRASRLGQRFGYFYQYLFDHFTDVGYGNLLHAFESYLEKNWKWPLGKRNSRLSADFRRRHVWIPAKMVAKELHTSRRQIELLLNAGKISGNSVRTQSGRTILCINRHEIPTIRSALEDLIDQKTACIMLGISKMRMRQLTNNQVLGHGLSPKATGTSRWALSKTFLETLLILGGGLPESSEKDAPDLVSLRSALHTRLQRWYLFPRLIIDVIKAKIVPVAIAKDEIGIAAWMFDKSELRQWISKQIKGQREGAMSIPEAAVHLGVKQEAIYHMVNKGLIPHVLEVDSLQRMIEVTALELFKERYALGPELGKRIGIPAFVLAKRLFDQGIVPISGPQIDSGRQNVYMRSEDLDQAIQQIGMERIEYTKMLEKRAAESNSFRKCGKA